MTVSRRSFFGIAAGAAAVAAGGVASAQPGYLQGVINRYGYTQVGLDLAAGPDRTVVGEAVYDVVQQQIRWENLSYYYGVEGDPIGGLLQEVADKPVVHSPEVRAAIRAHDAKKKMTRKQFERSLQSPIGKGRLE